MLILTKPIANADTASSRIRCYRFLKYLPSEFAFKEFKHTIEGNLLYIQKLANQQMINFAKQYASRRIPVVYDIDDDFGVWPGMDERGMLNIATAITTDTEERKEYLQKFTKSPVYVIPDALDYVTETEPPIAINEKIKCVSTFGSDGGIEESVSFLRAIPSSYSVIYISKSVNSRLNNAKKIDWALNTFIKELKKTDVSILAHPNDIKGSMKSNNRLLVCMSLGIPCIVSNTPAYKRTMDEIGCELLIANSPEEIPEILENIASIKTRMEISKKFRSYAWENFSPQKSSAMLGELFKGLVNKHA